MSAATARQPRTGRLFRFPASGPFPDPSPMSPDLYEKLGQFYLGREVDTAGQPRPELLLYDSSNLTTHGVCVGMTGSGKTGLCIALLEEAAMDGIPALIVDPKGDLGNLLLTFPEMRGDDFAKWASEEDARKAGQTAEEFGAAEAEKWKRGMAEWGQTPERIATLRKKCDIAIYTPGSTAGRQLSILRSFAAPGPDIADDAELLAERVQSTTAGLLGLLGLDPDPLRSREFSFLSAILQDAWRQGRSPDLAALIASVQNPPFDRIGVLPIDEFYPAKQRLDLAMALNNLLASPGFATWREGEPLEIARLLHTPEGKPRLAVLSIAHLSDAERMFFVTTLLEEVIAWMRRQPGTPSLRALLYMDEIFGFLPPVANPPSKGPLLLLLKQARAFGLGLLLATQNPADLDYKALANCGTWFIGRLQTDRDKMRVLEGLESASAGGGANRTQLNELLNALGKRIFLLNSVHLPAPVLFTTRWTMSYLRGPLTREQIRQLTDAAGRPTEDAPASATESAASAQATPEPPAAEAGVWQLAFDEPARVLHPHLGFRTHATFSSKRPAAEAVADVLIAVPFGADARPVWTQARVVGTPAQVHPPVPHGGALYAAAPAPALTAQAHVGWLVEGRSALDGRLEIPVFRAGRTMGAPFESESDFQHRLEQAAREERDEAVRRLRQKFAAKTEAASRKIERAREALAKKENTARTTQVQTAISIGTSIFGALFGKKASGIGHIGRASTAARGANRAIKESTDAGLAREKLTAAEQEAAALADELEAQIAALPSPATVGDSARETLRLKLDPGTLRLESSGILWLA